MDQGAGEPPSRRDAGRPTKGTHADSTSTIRRDTAHVYLAAPVLSYGTREYEDAVRGLRRLIPDAELIEPKNLYRNSADWRVKWPTVLRAIDRFVFIAGPDHLLGAGVMAEIVDARFINVPIDCLDERGELHPIQDLVFEFIAAGDPFRFARVRLRSPRRIR